MSRQKCLKVALVIVLHILPAAANSRGYRGLHCYAR